MEVDYYYLLGVDENVSPKSIKMAYRKMAEVYHPDKLSELPEDRRKEGEEIMRLLNEAKSILLHPERRKEYDRRIGAGLELQEAFVMDAPTSQPSAGYMVAIEKETMVRKMSRVLDSMKVVFRKDVDFQSKIAVAEEIFEAQVLDDTDQIEEEATVRDSKEGTEIEMKLRFTIVKDKKNSAPPEQKGPRKFKILAIEGDDDEVSEDGEVDVEWD